MDEKPVAILGCGPAGLFAAHAMATLGAPFVIYSIKQKSEISGAQYLQAPIPGLAPIEYPDGLIKTILLGTKENYAERVYNNAAESTSWPEFPPAPEPAWDLRKAYDKAWGMYEPMILDHEVSVEDVIDMTARFPTVINTVPAWKFCETNHSFRSMNILVSKKMEYTGLPDVFGENDHVVIYNGTEHGDWYRTAKIFGHESSERVYDNTIVGEPPDGYEPGYKILGSNCDCHPNMTRTGRLGTWKRGVLTHMAFEHATAAYLERLAV